VVVYSETIFPTARRCGHLANQAIGKVSTPWGSKIGDGAGRSSHEFRWGPPLAVAAQGLARRARGSRASKSGGEAQTSHNGRCGSTGQVSQCFFGGGPPAGTPPARGSGIPGDILMLAAWAARWQRACGKPKAPPHRSAGRVGNRHLLLAKQGHPGGGIALLRADHNGRTQKSRPFPDTDQSGASS